MPQVEVRTRMRAARRKGTRKRPGMLSADEHELILELVITPRGSGNRNFARGLARAAVNHPHLGPHVKRARAGSSKVWVILRPSLELTTALAEFQLERARLSDVPGQLPLFT